MLVRFIIVSGHRRWQIAASTVQSSLCDWLPELVLVDPPVLVVKDVNTLSG